MHTTKLQAAIDHAASSGGGEVVVPPGGHVCGTLHLKSGVRLVLPEGCVLRASERPEDYPVLGATVNETGVIRALLFAENATDFAVCGPGRIQGLGTTPLSWRESESVSFRPETVFLRDCRNVSLAGFTVRDSSFWTIHLLRCEDVDISGLTLRNRRDRINTDGIDPDGCKRVRIRNCDIDVGDDGVVVKSTEGDDGEDMLVENCRIRTPCAGFKIGTETLGAIRNVRFRSCRLEDCDMGFGLFLKDAGTVENVRVEDLEIQGAGEFTLYIDHSPRYHGETDWGTLRNLSLDRLRIHSPGRLLVNGPVEGLSLRDIEWRLTGSMALGQLGRPTGSVRHRRNPEGPFPERQAAHLVFHGVEDLLLHRFHLRESADHAAADRSLLYAERTAGSVDGLEAEARLREPEVAVRACPRLSLPARHEKTTPGFH